MVIDLAVEANRVTGTRRMHGLVARGREVENGKPTMAKGYLPPRIHPAAGIIGSAVGKGVHHRTRRIAARGKSG
jgi:hypothetical protein